jgi:dihydrofolate reductase
MRRIRYSVAASLDGYIAGPKGESDWIIIDPEINFHEIFGQFDTVLMGRKTFEQTQSAGGGASGMPGMKLVVVSSTLRQRDYSDLTVIGDDLERALTHLCELPGKDIWLFGGGTLFRSLLNKRLVDSIEVAVIPVLLGGGVPLLPPPSPRVKLKLTRHKVYSKTGTIALDYALQY